jgi:hypothetical protein
MYSQVIVLEPQDSSEIPAPDVESSATRLIVTVDRVMRHCMCGRTSRIKAVACKLLVIYAIELDVLETPELETLILVNMPYGEVYFETSLDLSRMPKLQRIICLSDCIDLQGVIHNCDIQSNSSRELWINGRRVTNQAHKSDNLLRLQEYFQTPEVYKCSCYHNIPAGLDFFDLYDSLEWSL